MAKHRLYMLRPWKEGEEGPFYCPDCGVVEGFLYYSPAIRQQIDIVEVDFPRPRPEIVAQLGQENQNSPVLVLAEDGPQPAQAKQSMSTGRRFIDDGLEICRFLAQAYGGVQPHP